MSTSELKAAYDALVGFINAHVPVMRGNPLIEELGDAIAMLPWVPRTLPEQVQRVVKFQIGDRVEKIGGACWRGVIVGTYSTLLTPEGYAVESENEPGSVQIYPARALAALQHSNRTATVEGALCEGCPPVGYPTDKTRCTPCPRRLNRSARP